MPNAPRPLILTLTLEPALADPLNALRRKHFPPERNFLDAHVTLFHALPGEHEETVRRGLEALCAATPAFGVRVPRVRQWGKGVFAELSSPDLLTFRQDLAARWDDLLTPQEYQVAITVASGATNRETANALFLSQKTVEFHLSSTYRRLGIRSRSELAKKLAERRET